MEPPSPLDDFWLQCSSNAGTNSYLKLVLLSYVIPKPTVINRSVTVVFLAPMLPQNNSILFRLS